MADNLIGPRRKTNLPRNRAAETHEHMVKQCHTCDHVFGYNTLTGEPEPIIDESTLESDPHASVSLCEVEAGAQLIVIAFQDRILLVQPGKPPCYVTPSGIEEIRGCHEHTE